MANSLSWDYSRCSGKYCKKREQCLRHEQLSNIGPMTPVTDFSLPENVDVLGNCNQFIEGAWSGVNAHCNQDVVCSSRASLPGRP